MSSQNLYSDVLTLISESSHNLQKQSGTKTSLPYIIVEQLDQFLKNSPKRTEYEQQLTLSIRLNALQFALKKKNKTWINIIVDVFQLHTIDPDHVLDIVNKFLSENKYFDASLLVIKLELRHHFDIKQILVPLLLQVFIKFNTFKYLKYFTNYY